MYWSVYGIPCSLHQKSSHQWICKYRYVISHLLTTSNHVINVCFWWSMHLTFARFHTLIQCRKTYQLRCFDWKHFDFFLVSRSVVNSSQLWFQGFMLAYLCLAVIATWACMSSEWVKVYEWVLHSHMKIFFTCRCVLHDHMFICLYYLISDFIRVDL